MNHLRKFYSAFYAWLSTQKGSRLFLIVVIAVLAFDSAKIIRPESAFRSRSDFEDYYQASRRLNQGDDLYKTQAIQKIIDQKDRINDINLEELIRLFIESKEVGAYLYPPFFAFVLTPVHSLSYKTAAIIFQLVSLSLLALFLFQLISFLSPGSDRYIAVSLPVLLYFSFLHDNAGNGNVGFIILALCGFGLLWSLDLGIVQRVSASRTWQFCKQFFGGFLIGIASVIKIIPIFLSGVLFAQRRYLALTGFVFGILFGVSLPAVSVGMTHNIQLHKDWYSFLVGSYQKSLVVRPYANNQTISAGISKLLIDGSDVKQNRFGLPLYSVGIDDLPKVTIAIRIINAALVLSLLSLLVAVAWRLPKLALQFDFTSLVSLTLLTSLVSSGVSWYHTYSLLLIPLAIRISKGPIESVTERIAYYTPACLALFLAILPIRFYDAFSLYSVFTWAVVAAVIAHHRQLWADLSSSIQGV